MFPLIILSCPTSADALLGVHLLNFIYSFTSLYTYIMYFIIIPYYPPLFSPPSTEPLLPKESSVTA